MELSLITLIVFACVSLAGLAVLLTLQSLVLRIGSAAIRIRRPATVFDLPDSPGTVSLGRSFDRMAMEAGLGLTPSAAALLLATLALAVGGVAYIATGIELYGVAGAIGAMIAGLVVLLICQTRNMRRIREQLPSAMDLLARAVRAGESLEQAMDLVGKEIAGQLGSEFQWCARQLALGMPMAATMQALSRRIRLPEIRLLAATLTTHRKAGGNVASTLEGLADCVRERLNYYRQVRALTGAGRFSSMLIASLGPLLFIGIWFLQPEHLMVFFRDELGRTLFTAGVIMEVVGLFWVLRLLRTDY